MKIFKKNCIEERQSKSIVGGANCRRCKCLKSYIIQSDLLPIQAVLFFSSENPFSSVVHAKARANFIFAVLQHFL